MTSPLPSGSPFPIPWAPEMRSLSLRKKPDVGTWPPLQPLGASVSQCGKWELLSDSPQVEGAALGRWTISFHWSPSNMTLPLGLEAKIHPQCPCCVCCVPHPLRPHHYVRRGLWEGGKEVQSAIVHQGEGERAGAVSETDK